jgi:hypothetical protein
MVAVSVALVAVTALGVLRLGAAVGERGQAQTAADAAALGGAEGVRTGLVELLAGVRSASDLAALGAALTCGVGRDGAVELAAENGAEVTSYCYDSAADRVEVTVANRATGEAATGPATASAAASLGLATDACEVAGLVLACGDLRVEFERSGGELHLATSPEELLDQLEATLEPRLVE